MSFNHTTMATSSAGDVRVLDRVEVQETHDRNDPNAQNIRRNESFHSFRYIIIILGGLALGAMYFTRLSVTVAMVSMVNHTHLYLEERPDESTDDFFEPGYIENGEFNWSNEIQQIINSGYMIFYTIPQVFTTKLAMKYGIRRAISFGLLICALSCILIPVAAYWGWVYVLVLRCLNGAGASFILPSMIGSIENWLPYKDSAFGLSIMQFFATAIQMVTPLITGQLAAISWKWAFYVPALASSIFAAIWWLFVRDTPESCSFLSQKEYEVIKGNSNAECPDKVAQRKPKKVDLPWHFMFKIKTFYGFLLLWMIYCITAGSLNFLLPTYFNKVLKISIKENGFYNFIIQIGVVFSMLWPSPTVNLLQRNFNISLTAARRIVVFTYTSMYIFTISYIALCHEHQVVFLIVNRFFHASNDNVITSSLMSQYGLEGVSGLAYSVMNSIGNFSTVIFCWYAGKFLDLTGESLACWSWIFIVQALMNLCLFIIYAIFIKSEPISLASIKRNEEDGVTKM